MSTERQNKYLDYLIAPIFQSANRPFVLSFEHNAHQTRHTGHFCSKVEIKDYNYMIHGQNFLDQPVKNDMRTNDNIQKPTTG